MLLPKYSNPPLVETVLGVQFDPISDFGNAFLGAYWLSLERAEWPQTNDAPPLPPQFEAFTESAKWATGLRLKFSTEVAPRLQIVSKTGDKMIQVQNGRFHFNWRKTEGTSYPHFEAVVAEFQREATNFREFLVANKLKEMQPNHWEVTYVNILPKGTVWQSPGDWSFLKLLAPIPAELPVEAESISGEWHFVIPGEKGRLHIDCEHGFNDDLKQEVVRLTLTARGPVSKSEDSLQAVFSGCHLGHDVLVRSFRSIMSDAANAYWGLKNENTEC